MNGTGGRPALLRGARNRQPWVGMGRLTGRTPSAGIKPQLYAALVSHGLGQLFDDRGGIRMARQRMCNYAFAAGAVATVILLFAFDLQIAFPRG